MSKFEDYMVKTVDARVLTRKLLTTTTTTNGRTNGRMTDDGHSSIPKAHLEHSSDERKIPTEQNIYLALTILQTSSVK